MYHLFISLFHDKVTWSLIGTFTLFIFKNYILGLSINFKFIRSVLQLHCNIL